MMEPISKIAQRVLNPQGEACSPPASPCSTPQQGKGEEESGKKTRNPDSPPQAWLIDEVAAGLEFLGAAGLRGKNGQPVSQEAAARMILGWARVFRSSIGAGGCEKIDRPRVREAFLEAAKTESWWPAAADVAKRIPPRKVRTALTWMPERDEKRDRAGLAEFGKAIGVL